MSKVIGFQGTEKERRKDWLSMIELRKNYDYFKTVDISIATIDKNRYNYFLNKYVKESVH